MSGITLKEVAPAIIPTPSSGKDTIFIDSTNSNTPSYKDSAGVVHTLLGHDGAPGVPGADGEQGDDGVIGPQGSTGTTGAAGSTGSQGPVGPIFIPEDGLDGADGWQGPTGLTGNTGSTGNIGPQGFNGLDGVDADDPLMIPGPTGPIGLTGLTGSIGPQGSRGLDGSDADDPLMIPGPTGLVGPTGPTGPAGSIGIQGFNGLDGYDPEEPLMIPGPAGPGGGTLVNSGTAILDFGAYPGVTDTSIAVVGQTGIIAGSIVQAWIRPVATAVHTVGEHIVEPVEIIASDIIPGTGFTIYGIYRNPITSVLATGANSGFRGPTLATTILTGPFAPTVGGQGTSIWGTFNVSWRWT